MKTECAPQRLLKSDVILLPKVYVFLLQALCKDGDCIMGYATRSQEEVTIKKTGQYLSVYYTNGRKNGPRSFMLTGIFDERLQGYSIDASSFHTLQNNYQQWREEAYLVQRNLTFEPEVENKKNPREAFLERMQMCAEICETLKHTQVESALNTGKDFAALSVYSSAADEEQIIIVPRAFYSMVRALPPGIVQFKFMGDRASYSTEDLYYNKKAYTTARIQEEIKGSVHDLLPLLKLIGSLADYKRQQRPALNEPEFGIQELDNMLKLLTLDTTQQCFVANRVFLKASPKLAPELIGLPLSCEETAAIFEFSCKFYFGMA